MYNNIDNNQFRAGSSRADAVIIDVRTFGEFQSGSIPGAINIDVSSPAFQAKIMDLDKDKDYYVFCRSGGRSSQAAIFMKSLGFSKVNNLRGGIMSWDGEVRRPAA